MIEITAFIRDPQTGAILCAACYAECGTAYEMGAAYDEQGRLLNGYACDETATAHFVSGRIVHGNEK